MAATALAALLEPMSRPCLSYVLGSLTPDELADVARINSAARRRLGRDAHSSGRAP